MNSIPSATKIGLLAVLSTAFTINSNAIITGYAPGSASGGGIISAPALLTDPVAFNTAQQGFDELQGVVLTVPISYDAGVIPVGTVVDSHMIFLNKENNTPNLSDVGVRWTFSGPILGVMSDSGGNLEAASTPYLGASGSTYTAPYNARGMEGSDSYTIAGNNLTVSMSVSQPGDWIRVVTASRRVPDGDCSTWLFLLGSTALLGSIARRIRVA